MKKAISVLLALVLVVLGAAPSLAAEFSSEGIDARSCILIEQSTGCVLFEYNADEALPPASVTKTMTMLLTLEAIDDGRIALSDVVSISDNAASMGGSQVFLSPGETMDVDTLLKCMVVASANDAALALAEHIAGSEASFVKMMNDRAVALGCGASHFENVTGLDDTTKNHVMSARDIAIISAEVMKHKLITNYSTLWTDTIRDGTFGLTNTNRLIRFYDGATGLKTGSTAKAKFCISATATRGDVSLIAVVMGSSTRDTRNALARSLLDFGFANYSVIKHDGGELYEIPLRGGTEHTVRARSCPLSLVVNRADLSKAEKTAELPEYISAPIKKGDKIGEIVYRVGDKRIGSADILADDDIERISLGSMVKELFYWLIMAPKS